MRQQNHHPHQHRGEGGQRGNHLKSILKEHVHNHTHRHDHDHEQSGHPRRAGTAHPTERCGGQPALRQTVQHTPGTVHICVHGRNSGGNHHNIQNASCRRYTQRTKNLHERRVLFTDRIPGVQGHNHTQGKHIENHDAGRHGADCLRDGNTRVFRLTRRNTNSLNTAKRKHHHGKAGQEAGELVRHETAIQRPQVGNRRCDRIVRLNPNKQQNHATNNHGDNSRNFH